MFPYYTKFHAGVAVVAGVSGCPNDSPNEVLKAGDSAATLFACECVGRLGPDAKIASLPLLGHLKSQRKASDNPRPICPRANICDSVSRVSS